METLLALIAAYGLLLVFVATLLDQGGLPIPAYPLIVIAASIAHGSGESAWPLFFVAVAGALLADLAWYAGGRRLGPPLLRLMCRLSLSPDSCVAETRAIYSRWGPASLIFAKFVPGFAAVATTLAGETRTGVARFLFFDAIGAALWAGGAVLLGVVFHSAVAEVLAVLATFGRVALPLIVALIFAYVAWKWFERRRYIRRLRMDRVTVPELYELLQKDPKPLVLDVRSDAERSGSGWIPGARHVARAEAIEPGMGGEVIVYCDCPNEASAAKLAKALAARGFERVRPLGGGLSAWIAAGHAVERE
jgi:membrane protein DedA with SNARE-associated domain/rhodanese-related sulfurtransferase